MGCHMSKQLKGRKSSKPPTDASSEQRIKSKSRARKQTASIIHLQSPASLASNRGTPEVNASEGIAFEKVTAQFDLNISSLIHDVALSSRTTDSGDSPTETFKSKIAPSIMFDEDVLDALAANEEDARMREEDEFRAIIRSFG